MAMKIMFEHKGIEYRAAIATIEETHLGFEDHGILTISLILNGADGWGQSAGNRFLGNRETISPYLGLQMTAIMKVLGVLSGRTLRVSRFLPCMIRSPPSVELLALPISMIRARFSTSMTTPRSSS